MEIFYVQIEEEFHALTTVTQPLRDQWRRVRDAVLDEAAKQGQTNTDLKAMVQFPDDFDEGGLILYLLLSFESCWPLKVTAFCCITESSVKIIWAS
jgi:hypothetical protein